MRSIRKMSPEEIKGAVKRAYARVATCSKSCCGPFECGGTILAKTLGYNVENLPKSVTESFAGCGNPVAISDINEGETVLDLGSGAGLDVFMATKRVGGKGKVIGVDMTPEMVKKAKMNAYKLGIINAEFRLGDIENLPIEDETIDVVISNCVINLAADKQKAFKEVYRVLKLGGRMYISDIVIEDRLPRKLLESIQAYTACISGALEERKYLQLIKDAGFADVRIIGKSKLGPIASAKIRAYKAA